MAAPGASEVLSAPPSWEGSPGPGMGRDWPKGSSPSLGWAPLLSQAVHSRIVLHGLIETGRLTAGLRCRGRKAHEQLLTPESAPAFQLSFDPKDPYSWPLRPPALLALCHPLQSWHRRLPSHCLSPEVPDASSPCFHPGGPGKGWEGGEASPDGLVVTAAALALVSSRSLSPGLSSLFIHSCIPTCALACSGAGYSREQDSPLWKREEAGGQVAQSSGGTDSAGAEASGPSGQGRPTWHLTGRKQRTFTMKSGSLSGPGFLRRAGGFVETTSR